MNESSELVDVLLVEDNQFDAELTLHVIRQEKVNISVRVVKDGAEALDFLFSRGQFEGNDSASSLKLVLLDLNLPLVSGIEVLREIRGSLPMRSLPVVVLTSSREDQDIRGCYELGVNGYIVKPVNPSDFKTYIETASKYWFEINQPPTAMAGS